MVRALITSLCLKLLLICTDLHKATVLYFVQIALQFKIHGRMKHHRFKKVGSEIL